MSLRKLLSATTVADRVLLLTLCILSLSGMFLISSRISEKETVHVDVNGKPAYVFSLDTDRTVRVRGHLGETLVEISQKRVRISDSPCPNRLCVRQGWIRAGSVACLPNRVTVTISGHQGPAEDVDAVTR